MVSLAGTGVKRETLNLRVKPALRHLIDQAAVLAGKNRTDFVLDAARQAAEATVLDRTVLALDPKAYAAFIERLDAAAQPNPRLERSLTASTPWK